MENISFAILGFLISEPIHGYELFKEITDPSGFGAIYSIKIGRLYAQLNKLEQSEYVHATNEIESTRPPRKVYTITDAGREAFFSWMENPVQHGREIRINLLIKLFFALKIKSISQRKIIQDQVVECESWLKRVDENGINRDETEKFSYLVKRFRKSQIEGYINWLNWCLRRADDD
jgi:DNA-binding PadR family transcriptional regulator